PHLSVEEHPANLWVGQLYRELIGAFDKKRAGSRHRGEPLILADRLNFKGIFGLLAKLKGVLMEQDDLLVAASLVRAPKPLSILLDEAVNEDPLLVARGLHAIGVRLGISLRLFVAALLGNTIDFGVVEVELKRDGRGGHDIFHRAR